MTQTPVLVSAIEMCIKQLRFRGHFKKHAKMYQITFFSMVVIPRSDMLCIYCAPSGNVYFTFHNERGLQMRMRQWRAWKGREGRRERG